MTDTDKREPSAEKCIADPLMAAFAPKVANWFPVRDGETVDGYAARVRASGLSTSQRAMIAAYLGSASKEVRAAHQARKATWVSAARVAFMPSRREPCAVCGLYEGLTQAHHSFPLSIQFDCGVSKPIHHHDWLCPTHHSALHIIIDALLATKQPRLKGIPYDEQDVLQRLGVKFVELWAPAYHRSLGIIS